MPKASAQLYTDQQAALDALNTLEDNARREGDRELQCAAERARRELANPKTGGAGASGTSAPVVAIRRTH